MYVYLLCIFHKYICFIKNVIDFDKSKAIIFFRNLN